MNPFATKFWTPGVLSYDFEEPEMNVGILAETFIQGRKNVAQIVGPHGSGKTTLIESLCPEFERRGLTIRRAALHDGERKIPTGFMPDRESDRTVFVLDGFEQLSTISRIRLRMRNWKRTAGLILTTHYSMRSVPVLYRTAARFERFRKIVDGLTGSPKFDEATLKEVFEQNDRNFRNAFFELYDRWS